MANSCILPRQSVSFAEDVVARLTSDQKKQLGIKDNNDKDIAVKAVSSIARTYLNALTESKQTRALKDFNGFIKYLMDYVATAKVSDDMLEDAGDRYKKLLDSIESLKEKGSVIGLSSGNIHHVEIDASDTTTEDLINVLLSNNKDIVDVWKETDANTGKTTSISFVVRSPEPSHEKTAQERVLNKLERIQKSSRISLRSKTTQEQVIVDTQKEAQDLIRLKTHYIDGYITSNGTFVKATSVSIDVHGKQAYTGPVLAGPIGQVVDTVGRLFFDKNSQLWNDDGTVKNDEGALRQIITEELRGALTVQGFRNLIDDFTALENQINSLWGNGGKCVVFSGELRLFGKKLWGERKNTTLVGYPDLLVIDPKGIVHVLDLKTKRLNSESYDSPFTGSNSELAKGYGAQISRYIGMLESYGLSVDPNPYVVLADTYYSKVHLENTRDERNKLYVIKDDSIGIKGEKVGGEEGTVIPLGEYITQEQAKGTDTNILSTMEYKEGSNTLYYAEPRLHVKRDKDAGTQTLDALRGTKETADIPVDSDVLFQEQYDALTDEEKRALKWIFGGTPVATVVTQGLMKLPESRIDSDFRPDDLSVQETQAVANLIMYRVSELLDQIQRGSNEDLQDVYLANKHADGVLPVVNLDESDEWNPVYTLRQEYIGLSRPQLIKKLGIKNLVLAAFTVVTDKYDDEEIPVEEDYDDKNEFLEDLSFHNRARWLIKHKEQLFDWGTAKLRQLESCIVPTKNIQPVNPSVKNSEAGIDSLDVDPDVGDNSSIEDALETFLAGLSYREKWMMDAVHVSPKSTMSQEIKRLIESIILRDSEGNKVKDKYGWGFYMHVDSTKAVQTILDACANCETQEQQESTLRAIAKGENSWITELLDTINLRGNESLKTKFFRTFRRDQHLYCYSYVTIKEGKRVVETRMANLKTANESMRSALSNSFKDGKVGTYRIGEKVLNVVTRGKDGKTVVTDTVITNSRGNMHTNVLKMMALDARYLKDRIGRIIREAQAKKGSMSRIEYISERLNAKGEKEGYKGMSLIEAITNILNGIGIQVPEDVVDRAVLSNPGLSPNSGNAHLLLSYALSAIGRLLDMKSKNMSLPMGLTGNKAGVGYFPIIDMLADSISTSVESSTYQNGKTYYAFSNPSKLLHTIRNLKGLVGDTAAFNKYINDEFERYKGWYKTVDGNKWLCDWVGQLAKDPNAREALLHKTEIAYLGKAYKELGELGFQLSILHNYFGSMDDQKKNSNYRWFALPTMSNKTSNEFVRMLKYEDQDEIVDRVLIKTFIQEMNRMADVLHHFAYGKTATDKIDLTDKILTDAGWEKKEVDALKERIKNQTVTPEDIVRLSKVTSGAKFHFLWYLNTDIADDFNEGKTSPQGTAFEDLTFSEKIARRLNVMLTKKEDKGKWKSQYNENDILEEVREHIVDNMEKIVESELKQMEKIGLFDYKYENGKKVLKYQEEFGDLLGAASVNGFDESLANMKEALTDFIWQDIAANINIIQITGVDLAYFGSSKNYQKRIAQEHSPGIPLINDPEYTDGYLRSVHISDISVSDDIAPNVEAALMEYAEKNGLTGDALSDFKKTVSIFLHDLKKTAATDGQSYSSITSVRKKLALQGLWGDKERDAYDKIIKGDFSIEHLGILLNPTKPFVTADIPRFSGSTTMSLRKTPIQDKNSEYLLLMAEAILTGAGKRSKLAAISKFMEYTAMKNDKRGVDTVHFESVNKAGKHGIIDLNYFDEHYDEIYDESLANGWIQGADKSKDGAYVELLSKYMLNHVTRPKEDDAKKNDDKELTENKLSEEDFPAAYRIYNNDYVDTIPVERYVIQQEVPAHLLEKHGALYGSQIRILGISDISADAEFDVDGGMKAEDLVNEYKQLHAANIKEAYDELMEDFGLTALEGKDAEGNPILQTIALEDMTTKQKNTIYRRLAFLLKTELSKDGKYTNDIRTSCELKVDEFGNAIGFAVPLSDPCQSRRIQELINSIIKKRVSRQRIKGGPAVQVTACDNDLNIRFKDREGNRIPTFKEYGKSIAEYKAMLKEKHASIDYFECYVPIPDGIIRRFLTKPDGTIMSFDEAKKALPEDVFKSLTQIIGYRIPTEDKYSMIPMRAVGFVPRAAGEVVILPKEITFLTGSDFDIDKMYLMLNSFKVKEEESVSDVMRDFYKETGISLIDLNYKVAENASQKEREAKLTEQGKKVREAVGQVIDLANRILSGYDDVWNTRSLKTMTDAFGNVKNLENFMEWYQRRVLKTAFELHNMDNAKTRRERREARNNRILELQWAVLTNEDTLPKMLNPGNFNVQKAVAKRIALTKAGHKWEDVKKMSVEELENLMEKEDIHNTTLPSSKIYYQHQNMQGTQMVGIFANSNVSHAFLTFQQIGIALNQRAVGTSDVFRFGGVTIGDRKDPTILDKQLGNDGTLISKVLASFLAASVDTAKDPVLADMNVNTFTGDVATTLIRMGFDTEIVGLFLSQPVIMELTNLYSRESTDSFYNTEAAIQAMAAELELPKKDLMSSVGIKDDTMSRENFIKHLNDRIDKKASLEERAFQRYVLKAFYQLFKIASDVKELTFCTKFNSVSNAVGPTIADTIEDLDRVNLFFERVNAKNTVFYVPNIKIDKKDHKKDVDYRDPVNGCTNPSDVIARDPILEAFFNYTTGEGGASQRIFEIFFPHYFSGFQSIKTKFQEEYYGGKKVPAKLINQLLNSYIYYLLTFDYVNSEGERVCYPVMPTDTSIVEGIVSDFEDVLEIKDSHPDMIPNSILDQALGNNCLRIRRADDYIAIDTLIFNMSQLGTEGQQEAMTAWGDLITMNDPALSKEENEIIRAFGRKLFFYTLMRNGFTYSPRTMMPVASLIVKYNAIYDEGYQNYISGLEELRTRDMEATADEVNVYRFLDQFMRNNYGNNQLAPIINVLEDKYETNFSGEVRDGKTIIFDSKTGKLLGDVEFPYDKDNTEKLYRILLKGDTPRRFITVLYRNSVTHTIEKELFKLKRESQEKLNGKSLIVYTRANELGMKHNFIEYDANSDIPESHFRSARAASSSEQEESTEDRAKNPKEEQGYDDESYDPIWSEIMTPALMNLNYSKERIKKFKDIHAKAADDSPVAIAVQDFFDAVQEGSDIETQRKLAKDMEDIIEKNDACNIKVK